MAFEPIAWTYERSAQTERWQREQVWRWLDLLFSPPLRVLELGCGTGIDALHLAERGVQVYVTDAAPTMVNLTLSKAQAGGYGALIDGQPLAAEQLSTLYPEPLFDGCFSNFSALNCVADLEAIAGALARCLKPGAPLALVLFGRYCLWELAGYTLQGRYGRARRRWRSGPTAVPIAPGLTVQTYYHRVAACWQHFAPWFEPVAQVGIGVAVPPTYLESWVSPRTALFAPSQILDLILGPYWPYHNWGDHVLLVWRRRG
ncbi:class I SAM-dependent methyltransferase [Anthocerotibacter panamensis]|uniref:class I SAM-dependent methyltransferase n=1 Tax=Anthocerotibacter panamensis TaxID=2857077 RepID=UPI001C40869A|nr:class I SAM-dependent methyltransferase [Anthocerotibacter panamensis]